MAYENIIAEEHGPVGVIQLNRPKAMNALNAALIADLAAGLAAFEANDEIRVIMVTGNEKAFAAGADIKEMKDFSYMDVYKADFITKGWQALAQCRKPTIAAVGGYALGGGCELAMMADIMIAAETAKFGQPEITIGTLPGAGGSQRLTRAVGKSKAMEMCLTGRIMNADEAERANLVCRVVPAEDLMDEAMKMAETIASMSAPVTMKVKEAVNKAFETTLAEGLMFERREFHSSFALEDQKEGMSAFVEKRSANFKHR